MKVGRQDADFSHSLTDLMSGVAVMFLVIAAIFMVQAAKAERKAKDAAKQLEADKMLFKVDADLLATLKRRDQAGIAEIEALKAQLSTQPDIELIYDKDKDPRLLTIVFRRDTLKFRPGECEVERSTRDAMRSTLQRIFPDICQTVGATGTGLQKSITLEGHTDNLPPLGVRCPGTPFATACYSDPESARCKQQGFESNVQLSAARAQYVFFQAREVLAGSVDVASCLDRNFIVAGRGPMDPLDGFAWDKGRSELENEKNRRVVIKVRVMAASVERVVP